MSGEGPDSITYNFSPLFHSYDDVVVYVSCIFGILGAVILVALFFFILEHCGSITSQSDATLRSRVRNRDKLIREARKQTSTWVHPSMIGGIKPVTPTNPASYAGAHGHSNPNYESIQDDNDDDMSYINHIFSEVEEQADQFARSGVKRRVEYEKDEDYANDKDVRPSLAVAYDRPEKRNRDDDLKSNGIKVPMELEEIDLKLKPERKPSVIVPMDDFDINAIRREEERLNEEEDKDKIKVMVKMEKAVKPDKPLYKSQSIEYENPMIAKLERAEEFRRQQEQRRHEEEMKKRKSKKVAVEKYDRTPDAPEAPQKPSRRVAVDKY